MYPLITDWGDLKVFLIGPLLVVIKIIIIIIFNLKK